MITPHLVAFGIVLFWEFAGWGHISFAMCPLLDVLLSNLHGGRCQLLVDFLFLRFCHGLVLQWEMILQDLLCDCPNTFTKMLLLMGQWIDPHHNQPPKHKRVAKKMANKSFKNMGVNNSTLTQQLTP